MYHVMSKNSFRTTSVRRFDSREETAAFCDLLMRSASINDDNNEYFCVEEF